MPKGLIGLRDALFHTARAEPVLVKLGAAAPASALAVRYDQPADAVLGARGFRRVQFEILQAELAVEPAKGDQIATGAESWLVTQIDRRPETASWLLTVERANG